MSDSLTTAAGNLVPNLLLVSRATHLSEWIPLTVLDSRTTAAGKGEYFCTSKASKLSTFILVKQVNRDSPEIRANLLVYGALSYLCMGP